MIQPTATTSTGWTRFRRSRRWLQAIAWLLFWPLPLALYARSRPPAQRRRWWIIATVGAAAWLAIGLAGQTEEQHGPHVEAAAPTTTDQPPTSAPVVTVATSRRQPRSTETADPKPKARAGMRVQASTAQAKPWLDLLDQIPVEPEHARSGYSRALFPHWDDLDDDGCFTRCEVLAAQRHVDGTWLSEWDGYQSNDPAELEVDHVVALAEAWDSGADTWSSDKRDQFADDRWNLLAVTESANARKSDKDAAAWFPSRADANCLWATTVVHVKQAWGLTVDNTEAAALRNLLSRCVSYNLAPPIDVAAREIKPPPPPVPTTPPAPTTTAPPAPPATVAFAPAPPPGSGCTPGYSPCIPPGDDVDCAGGSGNGPRYVTGPVQVDQTVGDPHDLDADGNGIGCQS